MVTIHKWQIEEMCGYKPITPFWFDMGIAEIFGIDAIKETYNLLVKENKDKYKEFTELVMVLNWKIAEWYEVNEKVALVYNDLWERADSYAMDNFKGKELEYFLKTTD